jgi:dephospho-CoA kinase
MANVLLTGMSGTGKSTVIRELPRRGFDAVDLDEADWSEWVEVASEDTLTPVPGRDWRWREDRVRALLSEPRSHALFVAGCAENRGLFYPMFERVVLLTAPPETVASRLAARPPGRYGHTMEDRRKVAELTASIEPLLRRRADLVIDTGLPLAEVVRAVARLGEQR